MASSSTAASSSSAATSEAASVSTTLNYFTPPNDGSEPYTIITPGSFPDLPRQNWKSTPYKTDISNLRGRESEPTMDTHGFMYFTHESKEREFSDEPQAMEFYYNETAELVKSGTGAKKVVIFDHTIRRHAPEPTPDTPQTRQPVPQVHVDQTPASAHARVFRHLPESEAEQLTQGRYQIVNIWRPILYEAFDLPLALCDGRTVGEEDLVPTALKYPDHDGQTYSVKHSPSHKWYYLRGMFPSEVVFIKCFDSKPAPGGATLTPHTAFEDPTTPTGTKPRQSIEVRALVFY